MMRSGISGTMLRGIFSSAFATDASTGAMNNPVLGSLRAVRSRCRAVGGRLLGSVLLFQEVHKIQYFLLFFRRQFTQLFEHLLFDGHGKTSQAVSFHYTPAGRIPDHLGRDRERTETLGRFEPSQSLCLPTA